MAEFLLELLSEEIPAGLQPWAEKALDEHFTQLLMDEGLWTDQVSVQTYTTPRRLWLYSPNLPGKSADIREERRGPRVDAPEQAVEGFLKSVGLSRKDLEERQEKKGVFLFATLEKQGRPAAEILAAALPRLISGFRWPKSMHWGGGKLRWVRPLRSILCLLDGKVVSFEVDGIASGNRTSGHRVLGDGDLTIRSFDDYFKKLAEAHVVPIREDRAASILGRAKELAAEEGLELVEDQRLVDEVAGLVEWPVPLAGRFEEDFLELPTEVLISEMRNHQKYFALRDPSTGRLAPRFLFVANLLADDGGGAIVAGNERVLAARLSDARFFWDQDRKIKLEDRLPALRDIVFHEKLGTLADRTSRLETLAESLARDFPGCNTDSVRKAARLSKTDLTTAMVGEFPELQGIMGGYYAREQKESEEVALAIREHYSPRGPRDNCPSAPVSVAVALSDKLDTLVGFFGIGERPTGSKDPFALRRAALSIARLILENDLDFQLRELLVRTEDNYRNESTFKFEDGWLDALISFFDERLQVHFRNLGMRHDIVRAVFSLGFENRLVALRSRLEALHDFLSTDAGSDLLLAYKRAVNIVQIEEERDNCDYRGLIKDSDFPEPNEKKLWIAVWNAAKQVQEFLEQEDYIAVMESISALKPLIDEFFDSVTVNVDASVEGHKELRIARLNLLGKIRESLRPVADFSKIEG